METEKFCFRFLILKASPVLPNGLIFLDFGPNSDFFGDFGPKMVRIGTQKSYLEG